MPNRNYRDRRAEVDARVNRDPEYRASILAGVEAMKADDRAYKMQLAAIRRAGELTQTDIAARLGSNQGNVARTEHSSDMLYSTLCSYLEAAGATNIALTATIAGKRVEVELAAV